MHGRKAVKKPLISDVNRKKRLYWCHARKNWSNEWDKIIFSDEIISRTDSEVQV